MKTMKNRDIKVARKKLLEQTIRKVFTLHQKLDEVVENNTFESAPMPRREIKNVLSSFFNKVKLQNITPSFLPQTNILEFQITTKLKNNLGAETFGGNEHLFLLHIKKGHLFGIYTLLEQLKCDIQEESPLDMKIVGHLVEHRSEEIDIDPDHKWLAPSYYKTSESYALKLPSTDGFCHDLYGYSLTENRKKSIISSAFNGFWLEPTDFIASIFATYLAYQKDAFKRFQICNSCGKLHLPDRVDPARGKYCSDKCRNKRFSSEEINKCYRRQKDTFNRWEKKIDEWKCKGITIDDSYKYYTSPDKTEACFKSECRTQCKAHKGGYCENFIEVNKDFLKAYEAMKEVAERKK